MGSLTHEFNRRGIEQKTTFDSDFDIADMFGAAAIKDTYNRAKEEWISNVEYFTELVLVLNWKCWQHFYKKNNVIGLLYHDLFYDAQALAYDTFKGEDIEYFFRITD